MSALIREFKDQQAALKSCCDVTSHNKVVCGLMLLGQRAVANDKLELALSVQQFCWSMTEITNLTKDAAANQFVLNADIIAEAALNKGDIDMAGKIRLWQNQYLIGDDHPARARLLAQLKACNSQDIEAKALLDSAMPV